MLKCKLVPPSARSPFWRIRGGTYPHNGKRIDATTGTTSKREADEILTKFQRDLLNGVLGKISRTFCEAALSYIEARNPTGSQREAIVGRLRKSDNEISPCLVLDIGERDCREITQETVNEIVRNRFHDQSPRRTLQARHYRPGIDPAVDGSAQLRAHAELVR